MNRIGSLTGNLANFFVLISITAAVGCGADKPADTAPPAQNTLTTAPSAATDADTLTVQWNPQDQINDPRSQAISVPADLTAVRAHETRRYVPMFNGHSMSGVREAFFDVQPGSPIPHHESIRVVDLQTDEKGVILSLIPETDYILTFTTDGTFFDVRDANGKPVHAY